MVNLRQLQDLRVPRQVRISHWLLCLYTLLVMQGQCEDSKLTESSGRVCIACCQAKGK